MGQQNHPDQNNNLKKKAKFVFFFIDQTNTIVPLILFLKAKQE